jgi:CheY-like chemotaxis protein
MTAGGAQQSRERILIAEDDEGIRNLLTKLLRRYGYHTESVRDGREAVDELARNRYEVLILDLMMPAMTGHDVLEHLRAHPCGGLRVIILSAVAPREIREIAGDPVAAILSKPFQLSELVEVVARVASGTSGDA